MPRLIGRRTHEGLVVDLRVAASPNRRDFLQRRGTPVGDVPITIKAILDTGAGMSCIAMPILTRLPVRAWGTAKVVTPAGGLSERPTFDVSLVIPGEAGFGSFMFPVTRIVGVQPASTDGIIGLDLLDHCRLDYNGKTGLFTLEMD